MNQIPMKSASTGISVKYYGQKKGMVMIMNVNLNLYHIFYTVAKTGNISLAAKELYISQPAVSKSVSRLEEILDTTLLKRSSRGVTLTAEGTLLAGQLETAFASISYGEEQLRKINELGIGQITIGVSTTLCKYVLLPYLKNFIHKNPHIRVSIACQPTIETIHSLQKGTIDIGLIGESSGIGDLDFLPVMEVQDEFVTTKRYLQNLATRFGEKKEHLYESNNEMIWNEGTFLMLHEENISRRYIDSYLQKEQIVLSQFIEISTMDLIIEFAKIDMGIACVIGNFVENELAKQTLIKLPLASPIPPRKIGFAWKCQTNPTVSVQKFRDIISSLQ